jgi:hypothetical protein
LAHRQRRAVKEALFTVAAVVVFILARAIHAQVRQRLLSCAMSALPPKADIGTQSLNVRFVPKAVIAL